MKTFVVAIPLFDHTMTVVAYRLCDRNADKLFGTANDYQEMGEYLLSPGLNLVEKVGIEPFAADKLLFADLNQYLLLMGVPTNLHIPPEQLVCTLPCTIPQDDLILEKCRNLLGRGYRLALNGFPLQAPKSPLMEMVSYVFLDYGANNYSTQLKAMMPYLQEKYVIISNLPDSASYDKVSSIPRAYFSGRFYSQPITRNAGPISPLKVNALHLLSQTNQEDFDLGEVAQVVEKDPSISIALMRFINSPALGMRQKISSIRNAVAILGQKEMRRWVNVAVSVSLAEDRPGEITRLSLVRAKFAENLANYYEMGVLAPSLFMAGLFSLLDVILERPMEDAINEISVDERVRMALVERKGPLYEVLDLIYAYEQASWDKVSINMIRNNLDVESITGAFIDALVWYKQLLMAIEEEETAEPEEEFTAEAATEEPAEEDATEKTAEPPAPPEE